MNKTGIGKPQGLGIAHERKRHLLLLALDWTRRKDPPVSLGQASILANLRQKGVSVTPKAWSVNHPQFKLEEVHAFVMRHADAQTDLALGAYVWHEPQTQDLLHRLKQDGFPGRIILGGPQVSYTKTGLEQYYPQADIFIRGYAEDALARLCLSDLEKPCIAGVHYAREPDLGLSATADLEKLPSPFLTGLIPPQPFIRWETQRGCPFRCSFCQHRESDVSMVRRQFSVSRIMQEAHWILEHPIIQDIAVLDPTFNSGPHYLKVLETLTQGKYRGKLALQCRVEMVRDEFLDAIEKLNQTAQVVLEFGLQTIHRDEAKAIQRPNNMSKVRQVFAETRKRGIAIEVSLIFGLPYQTLQSFQASIDFCKNQGVPTIYAYPLMLLRGTPLHAQKEQLGLVESSDVNLQIDRVQANIPHVISSPSFTYEEWCKMAKIAEDLDEYNAEQAAEKRTKLSAKMSSTLQHTTFWQSAHSSNQSVRSENRNLSDDAEAALDFNLGIK